MDKSQLAVSTYQKIASIYNDQYFNDLSDTPYIDKFLTKLPEEGSILDVGCGPGQFSKYMTNKGFSVSGIDLSTKMLDIAATNVPNGKFIEMDMRKLTFPNDSFDGLLAAYSLIHIPSEDILDTLKQFNKVLKPNGYIELITQKGEPDQIVDEPFLPSEKMFFNFFTTQRINSFLEAGGFKVEEQYEADSLDPESCSDKIIYTIAKSLT